MKLASSYWNNLPSAKKTLATRAFVIAGICMGALMAYSVTGQGDKAVAEVEQKKTAISLGDNLIEDDLRKQIEADRFQQEESNKVVASQIQAINQSLVDVQKLIKDLDDDEPEHSLEEQITGQQPPLMNVEKRFPYPPPPPNANSIHTSDDLVVNEPVFIGGIAVAEGETITKKGDDIEKKNTGTYMSPGFMDGMLLTGLKAETIEGASDNPEPMIIRVQAPAVLPNRVKANLKGCFVVAHGFGKLNKERIEARLVSLHCLNQDQQAVIDEPIKGFVVDGDGTKGIASRVVTKAGANTARMFVSGLLSGFGEGIEQSNSNITVSPLGGTVDTTSLNSDQSFRRGLGKGISDASNDLSKVFLDLVRQSSPVLEVGPAKKITLALTEGVYLTIRDMHEFKG